MASYCLDLFFPHEELRACTLRLLKIAAPGCNIALVQLGSAEEAGMPYCIRVFTTEAQDLFDAISDMLGEAGNEIDAMTIDDEEDAGYSPFCARDEPFDITTWAPT